MIISRPGFKTCHQFVDPIRHTQADTKITFPETIQQTSEFQNIALQQVMQRFRAQLHTSSYIKQS